MAEALRQHEERGYNSMKLKTWKRSMEDVRLVEDMRKALGDKAFLYVDGNGSYTEGEARTILARVADYNATFIEEPCKFSDPLGRPLSRRICRSRCSAISACNRSRTCSSTSGSARSAPSASSFAAPASRNR